MKERFRGYAVLWQRLGFAGFLLYKIQILHRRLFRIRSPFTLRSKYSRFKLLCRPGTSDLAVFWQIFVDREYRCLDQVKQARFILDCGANVGYSAVYFLTRFPEAVLIAVEPDPDNCAMLGANLAGFAGRYRVVRSAIWSRETGLTWDKIQYLNEKFNTTCSRLFCEKTSSRSPHFSQIPGFRERLRLPICEKCRLAALGFNPKKRLAG